MNDDDASTTLISLIIYQSISYFTLGNLVTLHMSL